MLRSHTRRIGFWAALCLLLIVAPDRAWTADRYLIGSANLLTSPSLPHTIVDVVNQQGWLLYTESYGIKEPICEIFLAKTVAAQSARPASGKMRYSSLKEGALIGVLHLLPEATEDYSADFQNQKLEPGYYTMRYAVMPAGTYENGTKLGEFVVLSPASMDQDPGRILKAGELAHLGASTSGTDVAASMALVAPDTSRQFPTVRADETGMCIFQVRLRLASTKGHPSRELPLAIAMLTPLRGEEGS